MAKSVLITLTTAGTSTGNFELFSDVDGYVTPFETGVSRSALLAGYTSVLVPNAATIIRVQSDTGCTNFVNLPIIGTTTTTTTTLAPATTTTTASPLGTTTTTSSGPCECINYVIENISGSDAVVPFINCFTGLSDSITIVAGGSASFCACSGSVPSSPGVVPIPLGPCPTTTTTTSSTSTTTTTTTAAPTTTTTSSTTSTTTQP